MFHWATHLPVGRRVNIKTPPPWDAGAPRGARLLRLRDLRLLGHRGETSAAPKRCIEYFNLEEKAMYILYVNIYICMYVCMYIYILHMALY